MQARIADPTHVPCPAPVRWSRGNLSEFLPGVVTPLTWDFWRTNEASSLHIYHRLGLARGHELQVPDDPARRMTSIVHGWPVANVDALRGFIDRAPGDAGDAFERQLLGEADLPAQFDPPPRDKRAMAVAVKSLWGFVRFPGEMRRITAEIDLWWRAILGRIAEADMDALPRLVDEIVARNGDTAKPAGFGLFAGQIIWGRLEAALPKERRAGLNRLVSAGPALAEVKVAEAAWRAARGETSLEAFLSAFGFYGLAVGELANPSWREAPQGVEAAIDAFRTDPQTVSPAARAQARQAEAAAAADDILAGLPAGQARKIRGLIKDAARFTMWREDGKALQLKVYDAMRAAARRAGALLAAQGALESVDDIFFFTIDELKRAPFDAMDDVALWRKARRRFHAMAEIPEAFVGAPIMASARRAHAPTAQPIVGALQGVGASAGVAEGPARIILDPGEAHRFAPGDILVAPVTDPSWALLFTRAGGVVTDIGGLLSHGAVVARELGLPAVVNTRGATRTIPDGARIRIDGATGDVRILERPAEPERTDVH